MMINENMVDVAEGWTKAVLEKYADPLLQKVEKTIKDGWERFKITFDIAFRDYLKNLYQKYSKVKTILIKAEPQYIYNFFEVPYLEKKNTNPILADNINAVLDISNFVIIQGTGGIGKSTLLKHFFISAINNKDLIPVFLELKDINNYSESYEIEDFLYDRLASLNCNIERVYFEYALKSGCFVFLFDGYDEIFTERRNTFFSKLDRFCDRYSNNYYVIASRPFSEFIELQRFTVLTTCPFSKDQAISLSKRLEFDKDVRDRFVKALEEDLYEKHKSFASNPLLLSIMLLTFENYAEIPEKLHLFYANAFETLYEKHDATKAGYRREIKSNLSFDNFRTVFSFFCFFTYGQGKTEFSRDELISILKKIAKKKIQFKASDYVYDLENSLCLLYKDGLNYRFAHRSFQEYFAAFFMKELSDENMKNMSFRLITQDSFRAANDNVFSMLYDMCEDRFEQNVLLPVLIEFEEERGEKEELYEYYFNKFVDSIFFDTGSENGEKTIRLWLRTTYHDDLTEFVYRTTRIYSRRNKPQKAQQKKESMKAEELLDYLQKNKGYEMEDKLTGAEIKEDETAYKIFKETWIGDSVNTASILRNTLQNKKEKTAIDLDALFD